MKVKYELDKNDMNRVYYDGEYVGLVSNNICEYLDRNDSWSRFSIMNSELCATDSFIQKLFENYDLSLINSKIYTNVEIGYIYVTLQYGKTIRFIDSDIVFFSTTSSNKYSIKIKPDSTNIKIYMSDAFDNRPDIDLHQSLFATAHNSIRPFGNILSPNPFNNYIFNSQLAQDLEDQIQNRYEFFPTPADIWTIIKEVIFKIVETKNETVLKFIKMCSTNYSDYKIIQLKSNIDFSIDGYNIKKGDMGGYIVNLSSIDIERGSLFTDLSWIDANSILMILSKGKLPRLKRSLIINSNICISSEHTCILELKAKNSLIVNYHFKGTHNIFTSNNSNLVVMDGSYSPQYPPANVEYNNCNIISKVGFGEERVAKYNNINYYDNRDGAYEGNLSEIKDITTYRYNDFMASNLIYEVNSYNSISKNKLISISINDLPTTSIKQILEKSNIDNLDGLYALRGGNLYKYTAEDELIFVLSFNDIKGDIKIDNLINQAYNIKFFDNKLVSIFPVSHLQYLGKFQFNSNLIDFNREIIHDYLIFYNSDMNENDDYDDFNANEHFIYDNELKSSFKLNNGDLYIIKFKLKNALSHMKISKSPSVYPDNVIKDYYDVYLSSDLERSSDDYLEIYSKNAYKNSIPIIII